MLRKHFVCNSFQVVIRESCYRLWLAFCIFNYSNIRSVGSLRLLTPCPIRLLTHVAVYATTKPH